MWSASPLHQWWSSYGQTQRPSPAATPTTTGPIPKTHTQRQPLCSWRTSTLHQMFTPPGTRAAPLPPPLPKSPGCPLRLHLHTKPTPWAWAPTNSGGSKERRSHPYAHPRACRQDTALRGRREGCPRSRPPTGRCWQTDGLRPARSPQPRPPARAGPAHARLCSRRKRWLGSGGTRSGPGSVLTASTRQARPASGGRPAPASLARTDKAPGRAPRPPPRPRRPPPAGPSSRAAAPRPPCRAPSPPARAPAPPLAGGRGGGQVGSPAPPPGIPRWRPRWASVSPSAALGGADGEVYVYSAAQN